MQKLCVISCWTWHIIAGRKDTFDPAVSALWGPAPPELPRRFRSLWRHCTRLYNVMVCDNYGQIDGKCQGRVASRAILAYRIAKSLRVMLSVGKNNDNIRLCIAFMKNTKQITPTFKWDNRKWQWLSLEIPQWNILHACTYSLSSMMYATTVTVIQPRSDHMSLSMSIEHF